MLFQNGKLVVRTIEEEDKPLLAKWLSDPVVLEYYEGRDNPFDIEKVTTVFYSADDHAAKCMIEFDGNEIGYIQFYQIDEEERIEYGYSDGIIYGMDQFIGEVDYWNKGVGTLLVTTMVDYLLENKKADKVVMDPQSRNLRALKCYGKCGFNKVKFLPKHELHEGEYQDCWLIEYKK